MGAGRPFLVWRALRNFVYEFGSMCAFAIWTRDIRHICIDFQFDFILLSYFFSAALNEARPIEYLPFWLSSSNTNTYTYSAGQK